MSLVWRKAQLLDSCRAAVVLSVLLLVLSSSSLFQCFNLVFFFFGLAFFVVISHHSCRGIHILSTTTMNRQNLCRNLHKSMCFAPHFLSVDAFNVTYLAARSTNLFFFLALYSGMFEGFKTSNHCFVLAHIKCLSKKYLSALTIIVIKWNVSQ